MMESKLTQKAKSEQIGGRKLVRFTICVPLTELEDGKPMSKYDVLCLAFYNLDRLMNDLDHVNNDMDNNKISKKFFINTIMNNVHPEVIQNGGIISDLCDEALQEAIKKDE